MLNKLFCLLLAICLQGNVAYAGDYTLGYLYGGTTVTFSNYIGQTKGMLNAVSPDYLTIHDDGTLYAQKMDHAFVDNLHSMGVQVIPFLSNNWDKPSGVAGLNNREQLAEQISAVTEEYNFDGINVDIQNVSQSYRDAYTDFVRLLREKMPNRQISVAVAANPNNWTQGWHGSYDYAKLAQYSDFLMIMTYDESYYASPPGPVASKKFVEGSIQYALRYTTPDKLVLGIPFYGRYWKDGVGGNALTHRDVESLLQKFSGQAQVIADSQSVKATLEITPPAEKPKLWGGRTLDYGTYEIWYDNMSTLRYKIELAKNYNLRGTGIWALGQENTDVWSVYQSIKSPVTPEIPSIPPVIDVPDNEDSLPFQDINSHWAKESILSVADKGWMVGDGYYAFLPEGKLTRAQAPVVMMNVAQLDDIENPHLFYFQDTASNWAREQIAKARYYGFVKGDGANYYPEREITREEFATLVDKTFALTLAVDFEHSPFVDVAYSRWSFHSIALLNQNEIITGYPDQTFRPTLGITRAETAHMLAKLSGFGINLPQQQYNRTLQLPR